MSPRAKDAPLTEIEEAFLRAYARTAISVPRAMEADLLAGDGMPLNEYFTLMHLSEAPGRKLRMSELADRGTLSLSGMTRIVNRLEASGLVRREQSPDDGRGWNAVLTEAGLARLRRAWTTHLNSVRRRIFDHLPAADLPRLTRALQQMAEATAEPATTAALTKSPSRPDARDQPRR